MPRRKGLPHHSNSFLSSLFIYFYIIIQFILMLFEQYFIEAASTYCKMHNFK